MLSEKQVPVTPTLIRDGKCQENSNPGRPQATWPDTRSHIQGLKAKTETPEVVIRLSRVHCGMHATAYIQTNTHTHHKHIKEITKTDKKMETDQLV